jgi:NADPH-dependent 7-cyano-7-deazaguanine reductase QueF
MPAFSNVLEIQAASAAKKDNGRSVKTFLECVCQLQNGTDWDLLSDQYIARVKALEREDLEQWGVNSKRPVIIIRAPK